MNHATGSFILIDPLTNNTVAAGMILSASRETLGKIDSPSKDSAGKEIVAAKSPDTIWSGWNIPREIREKRNGHRTAVLWFTGYSGSGKSTIGRLLESRLYESGCQTMLLDGDQLRHGLCGDLGFSEADRRENIRRAGEAARLFFEAGHIVICAFISPFEKDRRYVRSLFPENSFFEIHAKCGLETCINRDSHGLYKKALSGEIAEFTGVSSPYEMPLAPEIIVETELHSAEHSCDLILERLMHERIIRKSV
jgi:bifunctional enzyme CysN/CysC